MNCLEKRKCFFVLIFFIFLLSIFLVFLAHPDFKSTVVVVKNKKNIILFLLIISCLFLSRFFIKCEKILDLIDNIFLHLVVILSSIFCFAEFINHFLLFSIYLVFSIVYFVLFEDIRGSIFPFLLFFATYFYLNFNDIKIFSILTFLFLLTIIYFLFKMLKEDILLNKYKITFSEFGKVSAKIFHELTNPLNTLSLAFESLEKNSIKNRDYSLLKNNIDRSILIIKKMSDFVFNIKKDISLLGEEKRINLKSEILRTISIFEMQFISKDIECKVDIDSDIYFDCNQSLFKQIILSVLSNAIESFDLQRGYHRCVSIVAIRNKKSFLLKIKDNGSGISPIFRKDIFIPFVSSKKEGSGIGLYSVKEITKIYFKGRITYKTKLGKGTTFTIHLPFK